jgi:TetR/AcrR family transcriptional repressor of nem operon
MPRPREFSEAAALERAMQVFWAKGYKAASLDDLCECTGLGRSSLYAAFGGKRALLHLALQRYEEQALARIAAALARPVPVREAIAAFAGDLVDGIVAGPGRRGCFIGNCAAELARGDRATGVRVRRSLERIEAIFADTLTRARMRGEIAAGADVRSLARFLVAGIQGLRLVGKSIPDRSYLECIVAVMLRCLDNNRC